MKKSHSKTKRNALCPCGSGVKYKKCCLNSLSTTSAAVQRDKLRMQFKEKIEKETKKEVILIGENSPGLKMSEVILEFADELLSHANTRLEEEQAIHIACTAWNFALLKQRSELRYQNELSSLGKQMQFEIEDRDKQTAIRFLIESFVDKKIACYPHIERWIVHYQINWMGDKLRLHIASKEVNRWRALRHILLHLLKSKIKWPDFFKDGFNKVKALYSKMQVKKFSRK